MLRILITLLIYIVILSILYLFEPPLMFEETGKKFMLEPYYSKISHQRENFSKKLRMRTSLNN